MQYTKSITLAKGRGRQGFPRSRGKCPKDKGGYEASGINRTIHQGLYPPAEPEPKRRKGGARFPPFTGQISEVQQGFPRSRGKCPKDKGGYEASGINRTIHQGLYPPAEPEPKRRKGGARFPPFTGQISEVQQGFPRSRGKCPKDKGGLASSHKHARCRDTRNCSSIFSY